MQKMLKLFFYVIAILVIFCPPTLRSCPARTIASTTKANKSLYENKVYFPIATAITTTTTTTTVVTTTTTTATSTKTTTTTTKPRSSPDGTLIVTTGKDVAGFIMRQNTEVFSFDGKLECDELDRYIAFGDSSCGGYIRGVYVNCGGSGGLYRCYYLNGTRWQMSTRYLVHYTYESQCLAIPELLGIVYFGGKSRPLQQLGFDVTFGPQNIATMKGKIVSNETRDETKNTLYVPYNILNACVLRLNNDPSPSWIVIGGTQFSGPYAANVSAQVLKFTYHSVTKEMSFAKHGTILQARQHHSCVSTQNLSGHPLFWLFGGTDNANIFKSSECSPDHGVMWHPQGVFDLPHSLFGQALAQTQQDDILLTGGKSGTEKDASKMILYLPCFDDKNPGCRWKILPQTLKYPRYLHVAFFLKDPTVVCSNRRPKRSSSTNSTIHVQNKNPLKL